MDKIQTVMYYEAIYIYQQIVISYKVDTATRWPTEICDQFRGLIRLKFSDRILPS